MGTLSRPSSFQYLYLTSHLKLRLYLNIFRGEPAIAKFVKRFTSNHKSSEPFAADTGSGLHLYFYKLHPAHG